MEELGWERNIWSPWSNYSINHHQHQQEIEEAFIFGSENNYSMNPIQDLRKPNSTVCLNPNIGSTASQHWSQTFASNSFQESLDSLISATNSNAYSSSDNNIPVSFPGYNNFCNNIISGISSGGSVTKVIDDGILSEKNLSNNSEPRSKKPRSDIDRSTSSTINFRQGTSESDETDSEVIAQMKEMIYRAAAFRPVSFSEEDVIEKRRRKNVRISNDPQTVAARQRREKISERIRVLQKLVPGGNKMDTASMLDEAANYLKFLRSQVKALEQFGQQLNVDCVDSVTVGVPFTMQAKFLLPHQQIYPTSPPA